MGKYMSAAEKNAWSKEINRLGNQIEHRRKNIAAIEEVIKELEKAQAELLAKLLDNDEDGDE